MFFINRGMVEVVSEDGTVVFATMNEGKFFGEISLVFSCPRTASIRCACVSMYHCVEVDICMYSVGRCPFYSRYTQSTLRTSLDTPSLPSPPLPTSFPKGCYQLRSLRLDQARPGSFSGLLSRDCGADPRGGREQSQSGQETQRDCRQGSR